MGVSSPISAMRSRPYLLNGLIRVVADFRAFDERQVLVQQRGQQADEFGLGLAAQTEQNEIVPGQNGIHDLRRDGLFIADNARKQRFFSLQAADQVFSNFVLYGYDERDALQRSGCGEVRRACGVDLLSMAQRPSDLLQRGMPPRQSRL